jgi:serine/threonine-protein kinase ATR
MPDTACAVCDHNYQPSPTGTLPKAERDELIDVFVALAPLLQGLPKARLFAMLALRRLLAHTTCIGHLDISKSAVGEWCLQSLRSSSRDLRLAACSNLKFFLTLTPLVGYELIHRNRVGVLDFLQRLWSKSVPSVQETIVLALSQVAVAGGDEELNIVLLRFVEYLGHPNPYISGLVYAELQKLARSLKMSPAAMLRPFWRTVAIVVMKNFQTRPVIAQSLCDLLGTDMNVDVLLMFMEEYILPYLVLSRKKDLVLRIALAHGQTMSPFDLCTKSNNFAAILSYLLTQSGPDSEHLVMSLLADVSPEFRQQDLSSWIKLEPILVACESLKSIGDTGSERSSKAYHGLQQLAQLDLRRSGSSSGTRKSEVVGNFLEVYVLGIMTQFTATFNDSQTRQPNLEKRRCLAAIGELLKLGQQRVLIALPQICACLRSAMDNRDLCDKAFESWAIMMTSLPLSQVEPLIDQTLAIIVRNWEAFRDSTQKAAHDLVSKIWDDQKTAVSKMLDTLPSLASVPMLSRFEAEVSQSKEQTDQRRQMTAFSKRLMSDNVALVEQALDELLMALKTSQEWLHQSLLREQPESAIADLTRAILDCCVRFGSITAITGQCARSLGRIGCLDPNRIETVREKRSVLAISNFGRADETVDFIMFFLEEVLVKAFLSAPNTRAQGFLAWAMQELLKICGLEDTATLRPRSASSTNKYRGWGDLDETVRNTLTPFLNSRYTLNVAMVHTQCSYPLFGSKEMSHREWLQTIVLDLLTRAPGENIQLIFTICLRIVRSQDISIPIFLLPYAALNLFVAGGQDQHIEKEHLLNEMTAILKQPLEGASEHKETIKLCSQRVFDILDYMSNWLQQRRKQYEAAVARNERGVADPAAELAHTQIRNVESVLEVIPADLISSRAIECKSFSRAMFHWEQYIRQKRGNHKDPDALLARLQEIYTQIDEPDGIEGISAQMSTLNVDQQILEHRKAGNWGAAQNWYEIQLHAQPEDGTLQTNLLTCLRETGQSGKSVFPSFPVVTNITQMLFSINSMFLRRKTPFSASFPSLSRLHGLVPTGPSSIGWLTRPLTRAMTSILALAQSCKHYSRRTFSAFPL